jgi:hypothetical protein
MALTINSIKELLELIQSENVSHELASKIATKYLNILDLTTSKEMLIKEIERVRDNTDSTKQFILLTDNGKSPLED